MDSFNGFHSMVNGMAVPDSLHLLCFRRSKCELCMIGDDMKSEDRIGASEGRWLCATCIYYP